MAISALSPSSNFSAQSLQDPQAQGLDSILGSLEQLLGGQGQGGAQNPLAQFVDQLKQALEQGKISPQDAMTQLQQALSQATSGQTDPSQTQAASPTSDPSQTGFPQNDQFQQQAPQQAPGADPTQGEQHQHRHHHGHRAAVRAAADALGMNPHELRKELQGGKSIADVAKERGIDPAKVEEAIKTQLHQRMQGASDDQVTAIADRIMNHQRSAPVNPTGQAVPATAFTNQLITA